MNPTPAGWPRFSAAVFYLDAHKAIDWLCAAFGFEVRIKVDGPGGALVHSELTFGGGVVMVANAAGLPGAAHPEAPHRSPRSAGGANTQALFAYVDDVEAHCQRARAAGAKILSGPTTNDYGPEHWTDRTYQAEDLEGHRWWFGQRLRG